MENWGVWKTIKIGFWLGVGFIVPQLVVMYSGTALTLLAMPSILDTAVEEYANDWEEDLDAFSEVSDFYSDHDLTDSIEIEKFSERLIDGHLHITGAVSNTGEKAAGSIEIEAELLDAKGEFIYECSEYISRRVLPGESENFLLKCGCSRESVPEYASIDIRIVEATAF